MLSVALGILKTFLNICIRELIQKGITVRLVMLLLQYEALEGTIDKGRAGNTSLPFFTHPSSACSCLIVGRVP